MRKPLQPCGTEAAYQRHVYYHEIPCEPCFASRRKPFPQRQPVDLRPLIHVLACAMGAGRDAA